MVIVFYLCSQCQSPLKLWVRTSFMARCTRYNIMWYILSMTCERRFSLGTLVSSSNKTDCHDIVESGVKHYNPKPPKYELLKLMWNQRCLPTLDTVYHIVPLTLLHSICWSEIKDGYHYRKKVKQIPMGN
jgi:hypothetical protein